MAFCSLSSGSDPESMICWMGSQSARRGSKGIDQGCEKNYMLEKANALGQCVCVFCILTDTDRILTAVKNREFILTDKF